MPDFNFDLFTKPDQYEETLLRDRKAFMEYWKDAEKAEFVRDVIALANTARMLGKPAYLILGVRNSADRTPDDICGIGEMFERQRQRHPTEMQAIEAMRHEMTDILRRYIEPLLAPEIKFNKLDEKIVGYVVIPPLTGQPFQVSREFRSGNQTYLRPGQCWLRFGESKGEVSMMDLAPDDNHLRYCYAEVPYVLPFVWERYFDEVQRKMQELTQDAPEEAAYQELRDSKGVSIQKIVDDFLAKNYERLLILQGAAGGGKSLFAQRLVNAQAQQGEQHMKGAQRLEQFTPPVAFVPIYYRLRDLTHKARTDSAHFTKILCDLLAVLWQDNQQGKRPKHPEKLFENPELNWLIVLDGLDEIGQYEHRREFLSVLQEFIHTYPRLRVLLTTRPSPGISLEGMENAKLVEIASLGEEQITRFLEAYRTDRNEMEIYAFIQECKKWQDVWKLLSVPAYLNAATRSIGIPRTITDAQEPPAEPLIETPLTASETAQVLNNPKEIFHTDLSDVSLEVNQEVTSEPTQRLEEERQEEFVLTLPRLFDQVYKAFWEREGKRSILNTNHLRCGTHKLAAKSMKVCPGYTNRDKAKRLLQERGLRWALEMGILSENEHEHIFFTVPSAQVYSAAKQLQGDVEGGFWEDVQRYMRRWQDAYRAEIENFYNDLTGNSLSTILQTQGGSNG